jgi:pseudoazurin
MEYKVMKKMLTILIGVMGILGAVHINAANYVVKELNSGPGGPFVFDPTYLHVQPGDTVTFEATDLGHNSESVFIPTGAKPWNSEISKPLTITLSQPGVYIYQCTPHNLFGMVGVIQVGAALNKAEAIKQAQAMEKKQLMNQGRISQTMSKIQ